MSAARDKFILRHRAHQAALGEPALAGGGFGVSVPNESARSLRCGLMVQTYASLETFLRQRTNEAMSHVTSGAISFGRLPPKLQDIAIFGAIDGLRFQVNLWGRQDPRALALAHGESGAIASSIGHPYTLSSVMFGHDRSNISPSSIAEFLSALGVGGDPWHHLTRMASRVGLGSLPVKDGLSQGYTLRNSAAHDAHSQTELQDIEDFLRFSVAVALGFDALASRAARLLNEGNSAGLGGSGKILESDITFRFIDPDGPNKREIREGAGRAAAVHNGQQADMSACLTRARRHNDFVIERDARSWPINWISTDCP